MPIRRFRLILLFLVLAPTGVQAEEAPVAVSPGDASKVAVVEGRCPTFSWGEVEGAKSYDLVVYRLGEQNEHEEPVLRRSFPGSVDGWTPALDQCLKRGGRYAWIVRAVGGKEATEWSVPSLFEVASGPSETEFEEAVAVVRRYLDQEDGGQALASGAASIQPASGGSPAGSASTAPRVSGGPAPLAAVAGDSALMVNGSAVVTVATFGGALCGATLLRYLDQGDGTVLDCNTGLIWLRDASCADLGTIGDGAADWDTAQTAAAALADGTCGLTDGSIATQWRQPTISEFCSVGAVVGVCPPGNASDSLIDSSRSPPYVPNAAGTALWSEGDAFVGVQSSFYWSATEFGANGAWGVHLGDGIVSSGPKGNSAYVWPVRSGQ